MSSQREGIPIVRCTSPYRGDCTYVRYGQMRSTVLIVPIMYVRTLARMRPPPWLVLNRSSPWLEEQALAASGIETAMTAGPAMR